MVHAEAIDAALKGVFSEAQVVGDKHPDYLFAMNKLAEVDGLSRVVIYRDVRDVANSTLKAYTAWGQWWATELSKATKVAERWVHAIELMESHADKVYAIRYEDLVADPQQVLKLLGDWLELDPDGFRPGIVRADSVGKHRAELLSEDLDDVVRVAGGTMERLGYSM
jgi:hypothetical protein